MCFTYALEPGRDLVPAEVALLCRRIPNLSWLDLTGGEIFVRPDIDEVLSAVLDNTPRLGVLHFPTNGWFQERVVRAARLIRERRPEVELIITVSIDGPEETHDRIRGRSGAYGRAVDTFRALREVAGARVYVGTTLTERNRDSLADLERELSRALPDFDARAWHWNLLQISNHFFGNADLAGEFPRDAAALVRAQRWRRGVPRNLVDLMEWVFLTHLEDYVGGEPLGFCCQALHTSAFVSADGILYPCHVYDRPLVDLRAVDFDVAGAWGRAGVRRARDDVVDLACGGCCTPCEAYPAIAGSPVAGGLQTLRRMARRLMAR